MATPSPAALAPSSLLTVGHGTATQEDFARRLREAGVTALVDIRIAPGSRRHPHFNRDALAEWLPAEGIAYRWEQRLGGFRKLPPDSPDTALRNDSFRAYAGYMRTPPFEDALAALLSEAAERECSGAASDGGEPGRTVVMCSESVWWRCHRRLVADHATLLENVAVLHLMPDGRLSPHRPTEGVRVDGDILIYDARERRMLWPI